MKHVNVSRYFNALCTLGVEAEREGEHTDGPTGEQGIAEQHSGKIQSRRPSNHLQAETLRRIPMRMQIHSRSS